MATKNIVSCQIFDPRSSIVKSVFDCRLSGVLKQIQFSDVFAGTLKVEIHSPAKTTSQDNFDKNMRLTRAPISSWYRRRLRVLPFIIACLITFLVYYNLTRIGKKSFHETYFKFRNFRECFIIAKFRGNKILAK